MTLLCRVMGVNRSGFYGYLKRDDRPKLKGDLVLLAAVKEIFASTQGSYGSRRMSKALRESGYNIGRYRARSLMRQSGLQVRLTRRFKVTTNSQHHYPVAPNLLDRQFDVAASDKVWGSDVTYLWTQEGWLYLAVVIDYIEMFYNSRRLHSYLGYMNPNAFEMQALEKAA